MNAHMHICADLLYNAVLVLLQYSFCIECQVASLATLVFSLSDFYKVHIRVSFMLLEIFKDEQSC